MDRQLLFQKALLQLDNENYKDGENNLRKAISLAEEAGDQVLEGRALCCLGDLLHFQGKDEEALRCLRKVLLFQREDDLLDSEQSRAAELVREIDHNQSA